MLLFSLSFSVWASHEIRVCGEGTNGAELGKCYILVISPDGTISATKDD